MPVKSQYALILCSDLVVFHFISSTGDDKIVLENIIKIIEESAEVGKYK